MKRYLFGLLALCLCLLSSAANSDWYINPYRLTADTSVRPTLVGVTASGISTTNTNSRTVSVTPPVGTTLTIAYIAYNTSADSLQSLTTLTLDGTALNTINSTAEFDETITSFFAYRVNPTTNVAQNLVFACGSCTWQSSYIYVWHFSGVNTSDPFANATASNSTSALSRTATFAPSYPRPYIVAGGATRSGGSGTCYTATNLTIANQGADSSDSNAFAAAANSSLVFSGSTSFSLSCSWESGRRTLDVVEVKGP